MELEEYVSQCEDPDALARFIADPGQGLSVRFWDNFTIDIAVDSTPHLADYVSHFTCPICNERAIPPATIMGDIRGMFINCAKCGQPYFVHEKIPFGGTETTI